MVRTFLLLVILSLAFSCQNPQHHSVAPSQIIKPKYAQGFEILKSDSGSRIVLFNLEVPGDTLEVFDVPTGPIDRVACLSTTHIAMCNKLNALSKLKAVAFAEMVRNPQAVELIKAGAIQNLTTGEDVDMEVLLSAQPQLFMVYPFGHLNYDKYKAKDIPAIAISEYLETTPLGRAEWIKVFGALLHKEAEADSVFNDIEKRYLSEQENLRKHEPFAKIPTVFTGSSEGDLWYAPPGNSFVATLLKDAGSRYIFQDSLAQGNLTLSFENLLQHAYSSDYWGKVVYNPGVLTMASLKEEDPRLSTVNAFSQKNIFYCNATEVDYFGDALMEPHVLLADLIHVFHPEVNPEWLPKYFVRIKE